MDNSQTNSQIAVNTAANAYDAAVTVTRLLENMFPNRDEGITAILAVLALQSPSDAEQRELYLKKTRAVLEGLTHLYHEGAELKDSQTNEERMAVLNSGKGLPMLVAVMDMPAGDDSADQPQPESKDPPESDPDPERNSEPPGSDQPPPDSDR